MELELAPVEIRVLGSLIEKERTTPDYYPLTLNALAAACNQKSNREPVMTLTEAEITQALDNLRAKHLVWLRSDAGARVPKYEHNLATYLGLADAECAVLCVLMLRGPQTVGEIRSRTGRMHEFSNLKAVEETLASLISWTDGPLVKELSRQPGRKESRFTHLLAGEHFTAEEKMPESNSSSSNEPRDDRESGRIARLEEEVRHLDQELKALKQDFSAFKEQFQ
ncbi:MAG: DUF480 domain-containing protein [Chitinivibrionales bacterium]|nr:DUF480 domain-containing protein [Chitinivibrionales bacterium]MBD3355897.1 DUF480 domain-containing protein [Chitinivibrionales bacterium]